ncbi:g-type lectin s-receptor-like serine/threonine-protein kinase sd1-1, partial [Quercus suber]
GTLLRGKEIAVKRLSKNSGQGLNEFRNEVIIISKLQYRNLVKLLGCCIEKNEKLLIFEYMHNKSLDSFIFDQTKSKLLDWRMRHNIIGGIVRGLLYLHEDSKLRIIDRDLKASNILLENNMNPNFFDSGLAKTFGGDQIEVNTNRIVGTYFGVLVLNIVSGKKNKEFCNSSQCLNLLGYAWRLWIEDKPLELIDEFLISHDSSTLSEVPEHRPNISSVVLMLSSGNSLPNPGQPGFYTEKAPLAEDYSSRKLEASSTNEITFTLLEAR